jgi:hypothetical protein
MYRQRILLRVKPEHWSDVIERGVKVNELSAKHGWAQASIWTQTVGPFNELVFEVDYPDLATFERETMAFFADPEIMAIVKELNGMTREDSGYTELWQRAENLAF